MRDGDVKKKNQVEKTLALILMILPLHNTSRLDLKARGSLDKGVVPIQRQHDYAMNKGVAQAGTGRTGARCTRPVYPMLTHRNDSFTSLPGWTIKWSNKGGLNACLRKAGGVRHCVIQAVACGEASGRENVRDVTERRGSGRRQRVDKLIV